MYPQSNQWVSKRKGRLIELFCCFHGTIHFQKSRIEHHGLKHFIQHHSLRTETTLAGGLDRWYLTELIRSMINYFIIMLQKSVHAQ